MTSSMMAAVLTGVREIEYRPVEVPTMAATELLVRVAASGICDSGLAVYRGTHPFKLPPAVLGHEFAGFVERVGAEVAGFSPRDLVCSAAFASCEECADCARGAANLCTEKRSLSHREWAGSFADHVLLRPTMTHALPPSPHPVVGALAEPLSIGLHAMGRSGPPVDLSALVTREITVLGSALSTRQDFADVIGWITAGDVDPAPLVTHHSPLGATAAALRLKERRDVPAGKVMLHVTTDPDEFESGWPA